MEELGCPRCKSTKYKNPSLKLFVNVCGHSLCEQCIETLFVRGSGNCEVCSVPIRRNNFRPQMFACAEVERDIEIRRNLSKYFNKQESDFSTLREYNDYLEEVETIIYNLAHDIDVELMNQRIEKYKLENQDSIKKNRTRKRATEIELDELIEEENARHKLWLERVKKEDEMEKAQKKKHTSELIDDLIYSDLPADQIVKSHKESDQQVKQKTEKAPLFSSSTTFGKRETGAVPNELEDRQFADSFYVPVDYAFEGPEPPSYKELKTLNYLSNVREVSSAEASFGLHFETFCSRALCDAYNGLFILTDLKKS